MRSEIRLWGLSALLLWTAGAVAGEVLGHISEENAPPVEQPVAAPAGHDRKITYRVICSPESEALPDCEHPPLDDAESGDQPAAAAQTPEFPVEADAEAEANEAPVAQAVKQTEKSRKNLKSTQSAPGKKASAAKTKKTASKAKAAKSSNSKNRKKPSKK